MWVCVFACTRHEGVPGFCRVCDWGREAGCLAHAWLLGSSQDKYLADMDELFSQVDEKRKVSCLFSGPGACKQ